MIEIHSLTKRFGSTTAVNDLSLSIGRGESVALWGANGAGKTTVIRCVLGLFRFRGSVSVGGHDVARQGKYARRLVGYVPQELGFNDDLRVGESVRLFARLRGVNSVGVDETLAHVGLRGQGAKRIRDLSGGMKQRLALAIALLGDPPVLVLDEVTASLDACGREEFVGLIAGLAGGGRTLLFASHRNDEVATLANRVVMLDAGQKVEECSPRMFADRFEADAVLHLQVSSAARAEAMDALRAGGFAPTLNGVGLMVPVQRTQRATPFRILADARIAVDDFEMVNVAHHAPESNP
ncbi:MAG: ABC transporter ATP-binding protein [Phycisphaerae bacterium]|nr:ABC transporter ATP-binding protein [Phycisphaerae bacterium]